MFKNSHSFFMKKNLKKKSLIISPRNLLSQQKLDQSLSFFVKFFLSNIPKYLVKLFFQHFLNDKSAKIV